MSFLVFFFYFLTLCSSVFMILCINPINSVLFLIFIFFNTSMIFILLNVDFLGLLFLMIYVGAIAVLFLFIVMMLNIKKIERDQTVYLTIGGFFLFFYFLQIFFLIFYHSLIYLPEYFFHDSYVYSFSSIHFLDESNRYFLIKKLGILLYYEYFYLL